MALWILRVNLVAKKSQTLRKQLGTIVPQRLKGQAERWYYTLRDSERNYYEQDLENLRIVIGEYYVNCTWVEKTRKIASQTKYRDYGHSKESPSDYLIRKRELLEFVYQHNESNLITEIMAGAPQTQSSPPRVQ